MHANPREFSRLRHSTQPLPHCSEAKVASKLGERAAALPALKMQAENQMWVGQTAPRLNKCLDSKHRIRSKGAGQASASLQALQALPQTHTTSAFALVVAAMRRVVLSFCRLARNRGIFKARVGSGNTTRWPSWNNAGLNASGTSSCITGLFL